MQIPIINGVYTHDSDLRTSYPRNLFPVPKKTGINNGYLGPADGAELKDNGPGLSHGGINWNGVCYRVMGTELVSQAEDGTLTSIYDFTATTHASLDYSFDYLSISTNNKLYMYNGTTVTQVTDSDLGNVIDHVWVDGYFVTTDGTSLIVTELGDPFEVNPVKYGSSEVDPDPIKAVLELQGEVCALNRHTIEIFENRGGSGFPFQRIEGAQITRGVIGTHACCVFAETIAFVGGGRNEAISVYLGQGGSSTRIATREIDQILATYTEAQLQDVICESRIFDGHQQLYIHLADQTWMYDIAASRVIQEPVWVVLTSGLTPERYKLRDFVHCYGKWLVADPTSDKVGIVNSTSSHHWGEEVSWEFDTTIIYNEGRGAIFHELELVYINALTDITKSASISTEYSLDGITWSMPTYIKTGKPGDRKKRLCWLRQGSMENWRIQKFKGTSDARLSILRLEARIESLDVGM